VRWTPVSLGANLTAASFMNSVDAGGGRATQGTQQQQQQQQ